MEISGILELVYQNFVVGYVGSPLLAGMILLFGALFLMLKYDIPASGIIVVLFPAVLVAARAGFIQGVYAWLALVVAGVVTALALLRLFRQ